MPSLLVVDDDPIIHHTFRRAYRDTDTTVFTAATGTEALTLTADRHPDAVILDLQLPDIYGLDVFRRIHDLDARIPVIILTASSAADTAIEAMKIGAFDYHVKPVDLSQMRPLIARALEISRAACVPVAVPPQEASAGAGDVLIGTSQQMQEVYKAIGRVAAQDITVLILGESGTGKELVARAIYHHSRRAQAPFLAISCAAIPETLLESELFGHEKGAFTGADHKRIGKFEQASKGTLFLDEIGDMTPFTQAKILRLLQEQRFERVGGNETIQTDTRLVAATSRDLETLVEAGQFRKDLYYRLSVFTIRMPPLRERLEDLPLLVEHLVRRFSRELDKEIDRVAPETLEALKAYRWPGNIRELQSVLKQGLLHASGKVLLRDFLPPLSQAASQSPESTFGAAQLQWLRLIDERLQADGRNLHEEVLGAVERDLLVRVLHFTGNNQVQTARILGISRRSLRNKIRSFGIKMEHSARVEGDQPETDRTD